MIVDLVRIEAAQAAVLDEVVRVLVMALVADVHADVVEQRAVLEPLAFARAEPCRVAGRVEERRAPAARPAARAAPGSCSARRAR